MREQEGQAGGGGRRERGRRGAGERSFLRFHVLLQPPQFADKGCGCQGDSAEKGKVSGWDSPVVVQEAQKPEAQIR